MTNDIRPIRTQNKPDHYSGAKLGRPRPVSVVDKDVILLLLFIYFSYDVIFVATGCESRIKFDLKESGRKCRDNLFRDYSSNFFDPKKLKYEIRQMNCSI